MAVDKHILVFTTKAGLCKLISNNNIRRTQVPRPKLPEVKYPRSITIRISKAQKDHLMRTPNYSQRLREILDELIAEKAADEAKDAEKIG